MDGKLIKDREHYYLTVNGNLFAEIGGHPIKSLQGLSLKNCQAIENGYDLDEMVKERFGETFWHDGDKYFKEGFQKALEILGNKKFSEDDMKKAYHKGFFSEKLTTNEWVEEANSHIQSLQQTEWDCTFNPDEKDSDGCLILKSK